MATSAEIYIPTIRLIISDAEIYIPTIKRLEAQNGLWEAPTKPGRKIRFALEKAGVQFIDDNDGGRDDTIFAMLSIPPTRKARSAGGRTNSSKRGLAKTIDWYLANADWLIPVKEVRRLGTRAAKIAGAPT